MPGNRHPQATGGARPARVPVPAVLAAALLLAGTLAPVVAGYQAGMEAFRRGDLDAARREFEAEVQKRPWFDYGHYMIGVCHLGRKSHDKAIESLSKAVELDGLRLEYRTSLAQAYSELRRWDRLVETLEGKGDLPASPEVSAQARFLLGFAYLNLKQYAKAATELEAASAAEPNSFRILSPLGIAQFLSGDAADAIRSLHAAVRINPKHADTQRYLAEAYLAEAQREKEPTEAENLYQSAALSAEAVLKERGPRDFDAQNLLARAHLGAGHYEEALQALDRALAIKPAHAYAHFNRGQALRGLRDWSRAEQAYRRAVELMPASAEAHAALAHTYEQLAASDGGASLEKALVHYEKAQALQPAPETRGGVERVKQNIRVRDEEAESTEKAPGPR
jgi:tetratricopeptide (TPR) repeat protein